MNKMKRQFLLLLFLAFFILGCISQERLPQIKGMSIYFPINQKTVSFKSFIQKNSEKSSLENNNYSILSLNEGNIVFIEKERLPNTWRYTLYFFSSSGELNLKSKNLVGDFKISVLNKTDRILLGNQSTLTKSNTSFLFSFSGEEVSPLLHDSAIVEIGIENDQRYIWFVSSRIRQAREGDDLLYPSVPYVPYNHVIIYSVIDGHKVLEEDSENANELRVNISGSNFTIPLQTADIPG